MAFPTKDKQKSFGSAYKTKKYDQFHPEEKSAGMHESAQHEAKESPAFESGEQEGMKEKPEAPQAAQVVAEHGPATSVHIKHDHIAHKHHVTSMHEDGHVHESDHETPEDAHKEASQLGGEPAAEKAEGESDMGGMGGGQDKMAGIFGGE